MDNRKVILKIKHHDNPSRKRYLSLRKEKRLHLQWTSFKNESSMVSTSMSDPRIICIKPRVNSEPWHVPHRIDNSGFPEVKSWKEKIGTIKRENRVLDKNITLPIPLETFDDLLKRVKLRHNIMEPIMPGIRPDLDLINYGKEYKASTKIVSDIIPLEVIRAEGDVKYVPEGFRSISLSDANEGRKLFCVQELEYGLMENNEEDALEIGCDMDDL